MSTDPLINKVSLPSQDHVLDSATTVPDDDEAGDVEMKDLTASEIQLPASKSSEGSAIANQEEVEFFLRRITDQLKWQELISKWLAFEKDYPIKGVFIYFFIILVMFSTNVIVSRTYPLRAAQRKLPGG